MELKYIPANGNYNHIALSGKLDKEAVSFVSRELTDCLSAHGRSSIIDMTQVSSISQEGIKLFLDIAQITANDPCCIVLYNPQPLVREFLETAGLSGKMVMEYDLSAALEKMEK